MNTNEIIKTAEDCEPAASDLEMIGAIIDKGYSDLGEAVTVAYMAGKVVRYAENNPYIGTDTPFLDTDCSDN